MHLGLFLVRLFVMAPVFVATGTELAIESIETATFVVGAFAVFAWLPARRPLSSTDFAMVSGQTWEEREYR